MTDNNGNSNIIFDFEGNDWLEQGIRNNVGFSNQDNDDDPQRTKKNTDDDDDYNLDDIIKSTITPGGNDDDDDSDDDEGDDSNNADDKSTATNDDKSTTSFTSQDLLEIIKQENLLYIPDDFEGELDADSIDYLKSLTEELREEEFINSMRSRYASDPHKLALFDYFMTAGPEADIPTFQRIVDDVKYYEDLNIEDENSRRALLEDFLAEGLNPSIPSHKLRLDKIKTEVDEIFNSYGDKDRAKEAKAYFVDKHRRIANEELQRADQMKEQQRIAEEREMLRQRQWHDNFRQSLNEREWNNVKKQEILKEQYEEIQLRDGSYAPRWWVKEAMIKQDPKLYQVYLDWLNTNFDLETGTFKNASSSTSKDNDKVTRKILDLISKKQKRPSSDGSYEGHQGGNFPRGRVDALKNI